MKELMVFNSQNFGEIKIMYNEIGNVFFNLENICKILDLENIRKVYMDLDDDEKLVFNTVTNGYTNIQGKKDRYVMLSKRLLETLREYWKKSIYKPNIYLFPGIDPSKPLHSRSVQLIVKQAGIKAGIKRHVNPHMLRQYVECYNMGSKCK